MAESLPSFKSQQVGDKAEPGCDDEWHFPEAQRPKNAGRKKNGGFNWTREGKELFDSLPKREPRPAPVEEVMYDHNAHTEVKKPAQRTRKRRRSALETANEADDK